MTMEPTVPVDPQQQIDQTYGPDGLIAETVHNWPPDGGGVRRWVDDQGQEQSEQVTGLPIPQPAPKTAAEIAAEHATIETIADMEAFRQALERERVMPRSTDNERDKLDKTRRKLRRLRTDVKGWVGTTPANNNQRDRRIDDLANAVLALTQRLNLLEGKADDEDLVDPGA